MGLGRLKGPALRWAADRLGLLAAVWLGAFAGQACAQAAPGPDFGAAARQAERATAPEPFSSWADLDAEIERLVLRGELPLEALTVRPLDRGELAAWLAVSASTSASSPSRRRIEAHLPEGASRRPGVLIHERDGDRELLAGLYARLRPVLTDGEYGDWTDSTRAGLRAVLLLGTRAVFSGGLFAAEVPRGRSFADPLVAGTDLILHEEQMTLSARALGLRLRLGRDRHRWGPGRTGTLLLSDAGQPFNFCEYRVRLGARLSFIALTGATSLHQKRYLAAHRLTWTPRGDLSIGLAEGARYQANDPHVLYASGIVPYTLVERFDFQDNLDQSDRGLQRNNTLWSCDVAWRPRPGWLLYGELLADDIGTEDAETPSRGAYQAGVLYAPRWRGWDWTLGLEHTRVSRFTYAVYYQEQCRCDWEHQHEPLGYREGPDVAATSARCAVDLSPQWGGRIWLDHLSRGEGRLGDAWFPSSTGCEPGPQCGAASAWVLGGDVRRAWALGLAVAYRPAPIVRASVWGEARHAAGDGDARGEGWGSRLGVTLEAGME